MSWFFLNQLINPEKASNWDFPSNCTALAFGNSHIAIQTTSFLKKDYQIAESLYISHHPCVFKSPNFLFSIELRKYRDNSIINHYNK